MTHLRETAMVGTEIERRFLVLLPPSGLPQRRILQAYVAPGEPSVRVRFFEGRWVQTVKGRGFAKTEVEFPLAAEYGEALYRLAEGRTIDKTRHQMDRWEIDVFHGRHAGLAIAEIELASTDEPLPPFPRDLVVLGEITGQDEFSNRLLSLLDRTGAAALIRRVYGAYGYRDATGERLDGPECESPWTISPRAR